MKNIKKIIKILFVLLIIASLGIFFYLRSLKPQYSGRKVLHGLSKKVDVYFDDYGIPHIYAQNKADLYYAFGWLHAQDRLFQMEILRRIASGRLSEIAGKKTVKYDKFFRMLQADKASEKAVKMLFDNTEKQYVDDAENYLKGVNDFLHNGTTPLEYTLLGIKKEDFTPKDIFNIAAYMAFSFAEGFKYDPFITEIETKLGEDYLKDIVSSYVPGTARIPVGIDSADIKLLSGITANVTDLFDETAIPFFRGSNAWVLSGKKTRSGKVIFANDAHIAYSQPSVWYEAYLETPGFSLYGNFIAGIPFALIAHNRDIAWGITMFENDDVNYYFEEINPKDSSEYKTHTGWKKFKFVNETVKIKDAPDLNLKVKITDRGPVVNSVTEGFENEKPISVFWTFTHHPATVIEAFYDLNNAHSLKDVEKAVKLIAAPGLNIMYGDRFGNIAYWEAASLLKYNDSVKTDRITSWKNAPVSYYDFNFNPKNINPPSGMLYSANNQPDSVNGILYPGYYSPEDRAVRILKLLKDGSNDWTTEKMKKVSTDVTSSKAPEIISEILKNIDKSMLSKSANHKKAFEILKKWNGEHDKNIAAPVIYYRLLRKILELAMQDELGDKDTELMMLGHTPARSLPVLFADNESVWWDNVFTKDKKETRKDIFTAAFDSTVTCLKKELGNDIEDYKWKNVHKVEYRHFIGQASPLLAKIFNVGPFGVWGGREVINNINFALSKNGEYYSYSGPSMRIIIDFADVENSVSIIPTGQSGVFMSKHYSDQALMYNKGIFRKQMMNKNEIMKLKDKLVLLPEK
ncbi:MAG: penicillin acylase family protein [Chlorobi bacterium]|nr:penicillin acylase family protein [Chlorobiota bacterium]